ncbi:hypothetical protein DRE_07353 [Drechslerella stenobrocha 248]|uniref:Uncharacterized protein n=1 Tax=Drechslerella stenobrocha 248 TaxID=1043628 RepID=W7HV74_9PEZI|nr:hypothetical protein DRE_07353 [Drechslerella stenobrocha 248]
MANQNLPAMAPALKPDWTFTPFTAVEETPKTMTSVRTISSSTDQLLPDPKESDGFKALKATRGYIQGLKISHAARGLPKGLDVYSVVHPETSYTLATYVLCQQLFVLFYDTILRLTVQIPQYIKRGDETGEYDIVSLQELYTAILSEGATLSTHLDEVILHQFGWTMPFFSQGVLRSLKHAGYGAFNPRIAYTRNQILLFLFHVEKIDPTWGSKLKGLLESSDDVYEEMSEHRKTIIERASSLGGHHPVSGPHIKEYLQDQAMAAREYPVDFDAPKQTMAHCNRDSGIPKCLTEVLKGRNRVLERLMHELDDDKPDFSTPQDMDKIRGEYDESHRMELAGAPSFGRNCLEKKSALGAPNNGQQSQLIAVEREEGAPIGPTQQHSTTKAQVDPIAQDLLVPEPLCRAIGGEGAWTTVGQGARQLPAKIRGSAASPSDGERKHSIKTGCSQDSALSEPNTSEIKKDARKRPGRVRRFIRKLFGCFKQT